MRATIMVLSTLGLVACLVLGWSWQLEAQAALEQLARYRPLIELDPTLAAGLADVEIHQRAAWALLASAALGAAGAVLVRVNRPRWAAAPLLLAGVLPGIFELDALPFSGLLALAGLIALLAHGSEASSSSFWRAGAHEPHA